jgi:2-(1,2-epoxy-1,2-dihydrophenyl)acetyl-CoA isomerase
VIITGRGKAFCAGGDLKEVQGHPDGPGPAFHALAGQFHKAVLEIRRLRRPVIAAVNGVAAGGGFSLALCCDFRVMAKDAKLIQAYTSSGLCIDGGGTYSLARLVGHARALEIAAFDPPISAEQALDWGMVTKVADDAVAEAFAMAGKLMERSLFSFAWSKRLLLESHHTPLETQMEHERIGLVACGSHRDGKEGLSAFVEKRKPNFHG